jgi:TRAP-type C4-dicarboxylate transport system permease small subunit
MFEHLAKGSPDPGILHNWWAVVVTIGVIVGLLAGIQQLTSWIAQRSRRKAEDRVIEIAARQLDAEQAKEDAQHYERLRTELRAQVEQEVPREARRVYLLNRRDRLAQSLNDDLNEYDDIEQELRSISGDINASALDERVRAVVRETILPSQQKRRRRERWILALLVLIFLSNFTPIDLTGLVFGYFYVLWTPSNFPPGVIVFVLFLGVATITIALRFTYPYIRRYIRGSAVAYIKRRRWVVAASGAVLGAGFIVWGFYWRDMAMISNTSARSAPDSYSNIAFQAGVILLSLASVIPARSQIRPRRPRREKVEGQNASTD